MKKQSLNIYVLICISFITFLSCSERNNQSLVDSNPKDSITKADGPINNISSFTHPGISISSSILQQVSSETNSYRMDGYDEILDAINNKFPFPTAFPAVVYRKTGTYTPTSEQMRDNANLAYAYALKWARTGNQSDANKAITILNGWADNFIQIKACKTSYPPSTGCDENTPGEARRLFASWVAPTFAAAAEIIRHYHLGLQGSGWSETDAEAFEDFLLKLNNDYIKTIVDGVNNSTCAPNCTDPSWSGNNWGASAAYAQMAIGVFTENGSIYESGKDAIMDVLIESIIDYPSGEVNELASRDCEHPQYSLTALTYAADIHRLQGSFDIYDAHSKRLRDGWKGMGKAFDPNVFFIRDCSPNGEDARIAQGVEKIFNYWINHSELETLRNRQDPYGVWSRLFYGFTTYTDYCTNTLYPC